MSNYFNTLTFMEKIEQLGKCRFMHRDEFTGSLDYLKNKKIAIIGCGAQGLHQGLNMRDSGLNIHYVLRKESITKKNLSWNNVTKHGFNYGNFEEIIPQADLVINLTPDKQHKKVISKILPLMKKNAILGYSHGFNIVEQEEIIRKDITVIMVAPKSPGTEVRAEYTKGFGVPTLIAIHEKNDTNNIGLKFAKSWAASIGSQRAGVLESSFIAEVKSDLMGEQTILCGFLQACSLLCYDKMLSDKINPAYAGKLVQYGWETITQVLKHGGITLMMDCLSNIAKIRAFSLAKKLKKIMQPLFEKCMNDIITGTFSNNMMLDWHNGDKQLLNWRQEIRHSNFENAPICQDKIDEQEYFDSGTLMIAMLKAGIELSFDTMIKHGIRAESAYYESLHELPLIANTIARNRLHEMNKVISDTAEYGGYLFSETLIPLLKKEFMDTTDKNDLGQHINRKYINNIELCDINYLIRNHPIEKIGFHLRTHMKKIKNASYKIN